MSTANSYVVSATWNGHKLTATIYGEITPERIEKTKKELIYRAEQLLSPPEKPKYTNWNRSDRSDYHQSSRFNEYANTYDDYEPKQWIDWHEENAEFDDDMAPGYKDDE